MIEQQIVEYLKSNTEAYCLMPKECQEYLEGKPFIMLSADGSFWSSGPVFNSAELASTGIFRLCADYQPARWWFLAPLISREFGLAHWGEQPKKVDGIGWYEITKEYAAYLNAKPEVGCELRKVKTGDIYYSGDGRWAIVGEPHGIIGFRWCRPEAPIADLQQENARLREKYAESEARCLWLEVITRERDELKQVLERQEGELTRRKADAIEQFFRAFAAEAELDELKRQLSELLKRMAL